MSPSCFIAAIHSHRRNFRNFRRITEKVGMSPIIPSLPPKIAFTTLQSTILFFRYMHKPFYFFPFLSKLGHTMAIGFFFISFYAFYLLYNSYIDMKFNLLFLSMRLSLCLCLLKTGAMKCVHVSHRCEHSLGLNSTNRIVMSKYMHILRRVLHRAHRKGCVNSAPTRCEIPVFLHLCPNTFYSSHFNMRKVFRFY